MDITGVLRDLLMETAESLSGAERRRFMANTLNKLQLGQREAAGTEEGSLRPALSRVPMPRFGIGPQSPCPVPLRAKCRNTGSGLGSFRAVLGVRHWNLGAGVSFA